MSKYLPAPLLGESGHGPHHAWTYTSKGKQPGGKQAAHIGICGSRTSPSYSVTLRAPTRSLRSGPVFQPHPPPTSLLLLIRPQPHTLSLPQTPSCRLLLQLLSFSLGSSQVLCKFSSHRQCHLLRLPRTPLSGI